MGALAGVGVVLAVIALLVARDALERARDLAADLKALAKDARDETKFQVDVYRDRLVELERKVELLERSIG